MSLRPTPRTCEKCGKTQGCIAFVNPHTKKSGYWHLKCFQIVKNKPHKLPEIKK